jgi:deoxyribonuclease-4
MSGKGSEVGSTFEEIQFIIENTDHNDKLGVCLDTCHIYAAGYDIINDLDGVLDQFDGIIGLERLRAIHLNDSLTPFGTHKDRHAKIGAGTLGLEAIVNVINHPRLRGLPFYLETPNDVEGYAAEIKLLRSAYRP